MLKVGKYILGRVDIQGGAFRYGSRIYMAQVFEEEGLTEWQRLAKIYTEIYGYSPKWLSRRKRLCRFKELADGLLFWVKAEEQELHRTPTAEELMAGVEEISKQRGPMATIKALGKDFGQDPDTILLWPYSKVFGILRDDLKEAEMQEKIHKAYMSKSNGRH